MRVGWIGTGVMGSSMCGHVLAAGHDVVVHARTRSKAEPLLARGARWARTPAEAATASDVVFTMVGYPADVREVILGEQGVLAGARRGATLVDMTTSEPTLAVEIDEAARAKGVAALERVRPLLDLMAKTVVRQGGPGAGQHAKVVNQILIATGMIGVSEALLYGYRAGLDLDQVLRSVAGGAAGSWSLSNYGPRMLRGELDPGFMVEHFVKDMAIALAEARRLNLSLPGLALAQQLYVALMAQGHGRLGTHSLILALARLSDVDWLALTAHRSA